MLCLSHKMSMRPLGHLAVLGVGQPQHVECSPVVDHSAIEIDSPGRVLSVMAWLRQLPGQPEESLGLPPETGIGYSDVEIPSEGLECCETTTSIRNG